MGFTIDRGGLAGSFLGMLLVAALVMVAAIVVIWLVSAARQARRSVIEDEGDDQDLIA